MESSLFSSVPVGSLVFVTWSDIVAVSGWTEVSDMKDHGIATCRSVGFFVGANDKEIRIAGDSGCGNNTESEVNRILYIPTGCVDAIRVVENYTEEG